MSGHDVDERRRTVLKATAAAATAEALGARGVPRVRAAESTLGDWLSNVSNFDGIVDETGADEVRISVGAQGNGGTFAFDPPAASPSDESALKTGLLGLAGGIVAAPLVASRLVDRDDEE